jgi:pimeloyl-ACP methyl ester carboxylesterase
MADPGRVAGLIIQNAVAHEAGLGPLWDARRAFWRDRRAHEAALRENFLSLEATRQRHLGRDPRPDRYDPDLWTDEYAFLSRPGQADIQAELFFDYRTNVSAYPAWQRRLRQAQPPLLVLWGTYDPSFLAAEAEAYRADVPSAQVHLLDGGHFVLDTRAADVARLVRAFVTGAESAA